MNYWLAFLIGLAFPASTILLGLISTAAGSRRKISDGYHALNTAAALAVGVYLYINWGTAISLTGAGGWFLGIGLWSTTSFLREEFMTRSDGLNSGNRPEDKQLDFDDSPSDIPPAPARSPEQALAHVAEASSFFARVATLYRTDTRGRALGLLEITDHSILAIESDWACGDAYVLLANAYDTLAGLIQPVSETFAKECWSLSAAVIVRWAKQRDEISAFRTSPNGTALAERQFRTVLSGFSPDQFQTQIALAAESYALDRRRVQVLKEKLESLV